MTPAEWTRLKTLFEGALAQSAADRGAWLDAACGTDEETLRAVERLLAADESTGEIDEVPESVGPYRIVEALHVGGTAAVYRAIHRGDGAGFERRVALKVLHGALDRTASVRFDLERQILASLEHPNIARLYDSGRTGDDRADESCTYLAMEWVEGVPIDQDCETRQRSVPERLALFVEVCGAVQYAHQNLIVHRDLKPANILVDVHGVPKLLDFGIAKLLNPELSAREMVATAPAMRPMTPRYASPEQVQGGLLTTATDVYSLGVLLYELLTGQMPYAFPRRDPTAVAHVIATEAPGPTGLPRDLDAIVRTALEKEPARRYASAAALAEDIGRYLRHEPVRARVQTSLYRLGRFVRRHRLAVGLAAAAAMLALVMTIQSVRLRRALEASRVAEARADLERQRAADVSRFLVDLFEHADPLVAPDGAIDARDLVDRAADRIAVDLDDQPEMRAALTDTLGSVYRNLGQHARALELFRSALDLRRRIGAPPSDGATSLEHVSWQHYALGDFDEAEAPARQALALRRSADRPVALATSAHNLGELLQARGRYDEAAALYGEALALRRTWLGPADVQVGESQLEWALLYFETGETAAGIEAIGEAESILTRRLGTRHPKVAAAISVRGLLEQQKGDLDAGVASQREALALRRALLGAAHPDTLSTLSSLGLALYENDEGAPAVAALDEALAGQRRQLGERHPMVGTTFNDYGLALGLVGRHVESIAAIETARSIFTEQLDLAHPALTIVTRNLARAHEASGDIESATRGFAEVVERYRTLHVDDTAGLEDALATLARIQGTGLTAPE